MKEGKTKLVDNELPLVRELWRRRMRTKPLKSTNWKALTELTIFLYDNRSSKSIRSSVACETHTQLRRTTPSAKLWDQRAFQRICRHYQEKDVGNTIWTYCSFFQCLFSTPDWFDLIRWTARARSSGVKKYAVVGESGKKNLIPEITITVGIIEPN